MKEKTGRNKNTCWAVEVHSERSRNVELLLSSLASTYSQPDLNVVEIVEMCLDGIASLLSARGYESRPPRTSLCVAKSYPDSVEYFSIGEVSVYVEVDGIVREISCYEGDNRSVFCDDLSLARLGHIPNCQCTRVGVATSSVSERLDTPSWADIEENCTTAKSKVANYQ